MPVWTGTGDAKRADRLDEDPDGHDEQDLRVDERREDLRAVEAERVPARRRALGHRHRRVREDERGEVGEEVGGVGEQREAVGDDAARDLDGEDADREDERGPQPAPCEPRRSSAPVSLRVASAAPGRRGHPRRRDQAPPRRARR